ncbi:MAG: SpoIID/LytB domain-containing protein, partial [Pyrinomonadaceae bacterium]
TTTHCQRYRLIDSAAADSLVAPEIIDAVKQTNGEVLHDAGGRIVDSYFSASCGGATANLRTLWGVWAPSYLEGGRDEYCLTMPHHSWSDVISATDLLRAVQSDPRTDVGRRLTSLVVTRRDKSGRAELITIEGERRRTVSGWDFKIVVGRTLGWNLLKSSRFEIARVGSNYVFRGSGFGHGLGLCQEGAHVMARRGATYKQILAKYFPNTHVELMNGTVATNTSTEHVHTDLLWSSKDQFQVNQPDSKRRRAALGVALQRGSTRRLLSSEHFSLSYPEAVKERDAEYVLRILESSRNDLVRRVSAMGVSFQFSGLEILINQTTGDFVGRTGQPPWVAAATRGNRVELQPLELLKRRRILETTLKHELVHAVIHAIGHGRTPRWLEEGLALHYAGEGQLVSRYQRDTEIAIFELEQRLSQPASAAEMRAAYAAAYREVKRLISTEGKASVWR